jgi:hypothetical protein
MVDTFICKPRIRDIIKEAVGISQIGKIDAEKGGILLRTMCRVYRRKEDFA